MYKKINKMKWVKASERLPELCGEENCVVVKYKGRVTYGFRNFDKENPQMYFIIDHDSVLTNEGVKWLDETHPPPKPPLSDYFVSMGIMRSEHQNAPDLSKYCSALENYIKENITT